jgi:lipopolysaccharide/colanic/teichoic acid biosynthesis glycosyltransferase
VSLKRLVDLLGASIASVVTTPICIVAALSIKLTSRGPVFHRAARVGKDGELFTLLKFRTMRIEHGAAVTAAGDPRVTPIGRILRRTKIDELPQLLNVLSGDMSLVGPRPEDPRYVALYTPEQRRVLSVRPGMTSPAAVAYRREERLIRDAGGDAEQAYVEKVLPEKLKLDLDYVDNRSFWSDLVVLARTAVRLFV